MHTPLPLCHSLLFRSYPRNLRNPGGYFSEFPLALIRIHSWSDYLSFFVSFPSVPLSSLQNYQLSTIDYQLCLPKRVRP